ncbi:MAG: signal peptidase I [Blautia sp.]|nr:signal peptidase I [Blautia sp.]MDY5031404.1 signal peptidase I [Blautia sp.]
MEMKGWKDEQRFASAKEKLQNEKFRSISRFLFELVVVLLFAALTAVLMFQSVTMQESSMEPTISVGDKFFMNRLIYKVSSPKRGDIIVFRTNASDDAALHIRRVIALPGETVQISDGMIIIDGRLYKEGKGFPSISNPGLAASPITLDNNEYFVLGDNRNNSEDSRYGDIGLINKRYIVGKLWFTVSPVKKLGFLKG